MKTNSNYKQRLSKITTFIFDIDGVFTNGDIFFRSNNETIRSFNAKDGYAVSEAIDNGYNIAIITRGDSSTIKEILENIGVTAVFIDVKDKEEVFDNYLKNKALTNDEVLYMGDDLPDYKCIIKAGIGTCPRDAVKELRQVADYVSTFKGGKGAVRDVIEQTMRVQNKWFKVS